MLRLINIGSVIFALTLLATACSPKYPKCNNDNDCKGKNEVCVNGMCQQCRENKDCPKGKVCNAGRCDEVKDYCTSSADCPNREACKNNRCVACKSDNDCEPGANCKAGKCLKPGQCTADSDCPPNNECQNGNCVAPPSAMSKPAKCQPEQINFDFDEFVLTIEATQKLKEVAECIKSEGTRKIRLEGHCDPRGTEEYNLALGDRRANSVRTYIERLGVDAQRMRTVSKGKLEAVGTDESGWAKDRKVNFIWE